MLPEIRAPKTNNDGMTYAILFDNEEHIVMCVTPDGPKLDTALCDGLAATALRFYPHRRYSRRRTRRRWCDL
jgi:hypothetical protein